MAYVYILRCVGGVLYTGITTDIARRLEEHLARGKSGAKYTRAHPVEGIEALWRVRDLREAARVEWRIKRYPAEKKRVLVETPALLGGEDFPLPDGIFPIPEEIPAISSL